MKLSGARHRLMVMSGKGGVGKTTVTVNLALGLAIYGRHVGLMDADVTGPNVPKMLGIEGEFMEAREDGTVSPVNISVGPGTGIEVASMAFLVEKDEPIVWNGPVKMQVLRQLAEDVDWGDLDYAIVDLPLGTSDEPVSIAQLVAPEGAIIVTTPYDVALMDAERAVDMARNLGVPVSGIVENMSGFCCPKCGNYLSFKAGRRGEGRTKAGDTLHGKDRGGPGDLPGGG